MKRLGTGVKGLDAMVGGGFPEGDSILVAGSPGTGKTTLGLHFLAAGIAAGEPGVYITFEYLPQQIQRDAGSRGWDLKAWEEEGKMRLVCTSPEVLLEVDEEGRSILEDAIDAIGAKRLVIDSMAYFEFTDRADPQLRTELVGLMNRLRLLDVTPMLLHEIPDIVAPAVRISDWGIEFMSDAVVMLRYVELEGELEKAINVLKFRGGEHDRKYRRLLLTGKGMVVEKEYEGIENISGGSARRSVAERARGLV